MGFSDARLAALTGNDEAGVKALRKRLGVRPVFKRVDTCAAEFASATPYMYSSYERAENAKASPRTAKRRSFWAAARTGSARASSLIIAAATPPLRSRRWALSPSW
jgi:hypothetical protein